MPLPATVNAGLSGPDQRSGRFGPFQGHEAAVSHVPSPDANANAGNVAATARLAQTFTVPSNCTVDEVHLNLFRTGATGRDYSVEIYATSGGLPTGAALGSGTINTIQFGVTGGTALAPIQISPVALTAGTTYALVLRPTANDLDASNYMVWRGQAAGSYANGAALTYDSGTTTWTSTAADRIFKIHAQTNDLYGVFVDSTNSTLEVWKSTDSGQTWSEVDAANHPSTTTNVSQQNYDCDLRGSKITVAYLRQTAFLGDYAFCDFDTTTDTWGTPVDSTANTASNTDSTAKNPIFVARAINGNTVILRMGTDTVMGQVYRAAFYDRYVGGAWTDDIQISAGTANHYEPRGIISDGVGFIFWYVDITADDLYYKGMDSAFNLQAQGTADAATSGSAIYIAGTGVFRGSEVHIPFIDSDNALTDFRAAVSSAYSLSSVAISTISATTTSNPEPNLSGGAIVLVGTTLYAFWIADDQTSIYRDNTSAGGTSYGTDTSWKSGLGTLNGMSAGPVAIGGSSVGVFYIESDVVKYDSYPQSSIGTSFDVNLATSTLAGVVPTPKIVLGPPVGTATGSGTTPLLAILLTQALASGDTLLPAVINRFVAPGATGSGAGVAPALGLLIELATSTALGPAPLVALLGALATGSADGVAPGLLAALGSPAATGDGAGVTPSLQVMVGAPVAVATADALVPDVPALDSSLIEPPVATSSLVALDPPVFLYARGPPATADGAAVAPTLTLSVPTASATALGSASVSLVSVPTATGSGLAVSPGVQTTYAVPAATGVSSASAPALLLTVPVATGTPAGLTAPLTLLVPTSSATGSAVAPTLQVAVVPPVATATGTGSTSLAQVSAPCATSTGQGEISSTLVGVPAPVSAATGAAYAATLTLAVPAASSTAQALASVLAIDTSAAATTGAGLVPTIQGAGTFFEVPLATATGDAPTPFIPAPPQFIRPVSDVTTNDWTTTPLFDKIDETPASESDFIVSSNNTNSDCEVALGDPVAPTVDTDHIVRYRYAKDASAGNSRNLTVGLYQGTTLIASQTHTDITEVWTDGSLTLSTGEAATISDYSDLRLRFTSGGTTGGPGGSRRAVQVSWAEVQLPPGPELYAAPAATASGAALTPTIRVDLAAPSAAVTGIAPTPTLALGAPVAAATGDTSVSTLLTTYAAPAATAIAAGSDPGPTGPQSEATATLVASPPLLALTVPVAGGTADAIAPVLHLLVPVATSSAQGLDPEVPALDTSAIVPPVATASGSATPPVLGLSLPAATAAADGLAPATIPELLPPQGSVVGTGATPALALAIPVAAASSEAITTGGEIVPSAFSFPLPQASAQAQPSLPAPTIRVTVPAATVSATALAPSLRTTFAVPVATSTAAAPVPSLGIPGIVIAGDSTLTLSGGTATMVAAKTVTATAGTLTLDTKAGIVNFGHTVRATPGEIVLGGRHTRLSKAGDRPREIIARFDDLVTGDELVTIEDERTGETWTRPSKLMHIYQMGYGDKWRKAKERRFGRL